MTMSARVIYGMARHGDLPRSCRPRASADRDAALRHGTDCGVDHRARAVGSVRVARGRYVAGDARGIRAGQSCRCCGCVTGACALPGRMSVFRSGCLRRACNLPRHDRKRVSEMTEAASHAATGRASPFRKPGRIADADFALPSCCVRSWSRSRLPGWLSALHLSGDRARRVVRVDLGRLRGAGADWC